MVIYFGVKSMILCLTLSCLLMMCYQYWKTKRWSAEDTSTPRFHPAILELKQNRLESTEHFKTPKSRLKRQGKQMNLMIISQGRSGSSFVGKMFNLHPDVFYIYEPLHTVERVNNFDTFTGDNTIEYNHRASMILEEIFNCSFRKSPYLDYLSRPGHFRLSSRVLKSPPFCTGEAENKTAKEVFEKRMCSILEPEILNQVCKSYAVTVIKVLEHRIAGKTLNALKPFFKMQGFDNKILYLVRDPRAVLSSMYHAGWIAGRRQNQRIPFQPTSQRFRWYVQRICSQMEANYRFFKSPPDWARRRLNLLRYEDLVTQTENKTREILAIIGLRVQSGMKEWIYKHMHGKNAMLGDTEEIYTTKRNSSLTLNKWRLEASLELVQVVEQHCNTVMKSLGYILTNGSKTLQHRLDFPLFTRVPEKMFI